MKRIPNNQQLTWFLELNKIGQLDLNPIYQRKSVWSIRERTYFLDTILKDFPCPPIFLHKTMDDAGRTTYHVIDGKQRLETVIMFTRNEIALADNFGDTNLDGKKWEEISIEYKRKFWNYLFSIELIDDIEESLLSEIFDRFNRNSKKLNDQELRHAKYTGWLIKDVEKESEKEEWREFGIATAANIRRMRDTQFISELLLIILENRIVGFNQDYLNRKYADYEDPEESHPDFSEESFSDTKEKIKKVMLSMNGENESVTKLGSTFIHFYTLWAAIYFNLDKTTNTNQIAKNYYTFMKTVEEIGKTDPDKILKKTKDALFKNAFDYYQNARGANTDIKQRQKRLDILSNVLFHE